MRLGAEEHLPGCGLNLKARCQIRGLADHAQIRACGQLTDDRGPGCDTDPKMKSNHARLVPKRKGSFECVQSVADLPAGDIEGRHQRVARELIHDSVLTRNLL